MKECPFCGEALKDHDIANEFCDSCLADLDIDDLDNSLPYEDKFVDDDY